MATTTETRINSTQAKDAIYKSHSTQSTAEQIDGSVSHSLNLEQNGVVLLGDSITNQNDSEDEDENIWNTLNAGYFTVGNIMCGSFFNLLNNAGVSGETAEKILERFDNDVTPYNPKWVFVMAGTNDLLGSIPTATTVANLTQIYDKVKSIGARLITATIYPSLPMPSAVAHGELNRWIRDEADKRGHLLCDFEKALTDVSITSFPYSTTDYLYDDKHINAFGAYLCGKEFKEVVSAYIGKTKLLPCKSDPKNKTTNLLNAGTTGAVNNGITGLSPDGFNIFCSPIVPANNTVDSSIISNTTGNKIKITMTGTEEKSTFTRPATDSPVFGKQYYAMVEVDCNLNNCKEVSLKLRTLGGTENKTAHANRTFADNKVVPNITFSGVIVTPIITCEDETTLIADVFATATDGWIEIGKVAVIEV